MSYNQPHNSRSAGNKQTSDRQQNFRERDHYGQESSNQAANYDVPLYDPSTYDTRFAYDSRYYDSRDYEGREGRQEDYRMDQSFTHNRDYRSIQQDHANHQADYSLGDRERNDWEQRNRDWDRPQPAHAYRGTQFAGRQSSFEQRPHEYDSAFRNASPRYGGVSEYRRSQRWTGEGGYPSSRNQYTEREGYYPPQSGGWQQRQPSLRDSRYDNSDFGGGTPYNGGYVQQDAGFQGWLDRGFQGNHQSDQQADHPSFRGRAPKGYERSDDRIKEDLCERLTHDHQVDASEITVHVKSGVVTLEGSIADRNQKYRAEDMADNVSGVKDVQNRLNVLRLSQKNAHVFGGTAGNTNADAGRSAQGDDLPKPTTQNTTTPNITRQ